MDVDKLLLQGLADKWVNKNRVSKMGGRWI